MDATFFKRHCWSAIIGSMPVGKNAVFKRRREIAPDVLGTREGYRDLSDTIVTRFSHFFGGPSRTRVGTSDELRATLNAWAAVMQSKVLPYLDEAKDVVVLDRMVNQEAIIPDTTLPPDCYMEHIILAKLAENPRFDDLATDHMDRLIRGGYSTDQYDALLARLDPDYA